MLDTVIFRRLRAAARRFTGANEGNIAILFGIAVIPIVTFVGAAVDYTRANAARSSMQAALDSTALMLAKDLTEGTITTSQIAAKADAYFKALYTNPETKSITITATYTPKLRQGLDHPDQRLRHRGYHSHAGRRFPDPRFQHQFHLGLGQRRACAVAMVLDVTGSMATTARWRRCRRPPRAWSISSACSPRIPATSTSPWFHSPRTSTSAPAITTRAGSTGRRGISVHQHLGTCSNDLALTATTCKNNGKTWTPDRTKWTGCVIDRDQRLRHQEYDAEFEQRVRRWSLPKSMFPDPQSTAKSGSSAYVGTDRAAEL